MFRVTECGHSYVGEMWPAIRYAALADKHLPQSGGIADQSAWFVEVWVAYKNELSAIEEEALAKWQTT